MSFICPLCHTPLLTQDKSYRCANGHQFDRAKEGYVNLLPVQHKRSRDPGDSSEMMQARRAFLDAGHYQPLRDRLVGLLEAKLPDPVTALLDIGCGEGYYTAAFAAPVAQRGGETFGLDVSKVAVRSAAKRYPEAMFCVASSQRLPFADAMFDAVVRIYAPCNPQELARVVKPGGWVVTAAPGPRHLVQLKEMIYDSVKLHETGHEQLEGFTLRETLPLAYEMTLTGEEAVALLQMTPFAWRARPEVREALAARANFACETDFYISVWQRDQAPSALQSI